MDMSWVPALPSVNCVTLGTGFIPLSSTFLICKIKVMMPKLTSLRGRLSEIMDAEVLVQSLAFQKWQLLFVQQIFIEYLLWTEHQVLKIKQSKVPGAWI